MAELADAHGSGPCEGNFMEVQVLLGAPPFKVLTGKQATCFPATTLKIYKEPR